MEHIVVCKERQRDWRIYWQIVREYEEQIGAPDWYLENASGEGACSRTGLVEAHPEDTVATI